MRASLLRPKCPRRGVTLLEMLVVVALVILMMLILVSIFQAATGSIQLGRTFQELDVNLRLLDTTIRQDLSGATATFTPPLNPRDKKGYFEYGENAWADFQGEDSDDYLAFTTKAPDGRSFNGRLFIDPSNADPRNLTDRQPATVSSQVAEVIYFLRGDKLYRRVLLVVPERAGSLPPRPVVSTPNTVGGFFTSMFGPRAEVSWQGLNDISARVDGRSRDLTTPYQLIPNDLGDLTNRENRFARPRYAFDFAATQLGDNSIRDGLNDDGNDDGVPDYYPTLYPNVFTAVDGDGIRLMNENTAAYRSGMGRVHTRTNFPPYQLYPFPYVFPGMYSKPDRFAQSAGYGWMHSLDPSQVEQPASPGSLLVNHNPIELGDSLTTIAPFNPPQQRTWFGFPTWRETMSPFWNDPVFPVKFQLRQTDGLKPFDPRVTMGTNDTNFLPDQPEQFGNDEAGHVSNLFVPDLDPTRVFNPPPNRNNPPRIFSSDRWLRGVWEDDLIMTGVRSFDIKALDPDATVYNNLVGGQYYSSSYYDLGYAGMLDYTDSLIFSNFQPVGFGHEGRIPPLASSTTNVVRNNGDHRRDPRRPQFDIGDSSPNVIRLRRVWDTWSTDYTNAPEVDVTLRGLGLNGERPIYPAYPAPYPSPLRGIQIQIRVVDPRNERVRVLTIRHDFTDKL